MAAAAAAKRSGIDMPIPKPLQMVWQSDEILKYADLHSLMRLRCCRAWRAVVDNFVNWTARVEREQNRATLSPAFHAKFDAAINQPGFLKFCFQEMHTKTFLGLLWQTGAHVRTRMFNNTDSSDRAAIIRANTNTILLQDPTQNKVLHFTRNPDATFQQAQYPSPAVRQVALDQQGEGMAVIAPDWINWRGRYFQVRWPAFQGPAVCDGLFFAVSSSNWAHPNHIQTIQKVSGSEEYRVHILTYGEGFPPPDRLAISKHHLVSALHQSGRAELWDLSTSPPLLDPIYIMILKRRPSQRQRLQPRLTR